MEGPILVIMAAGIGNRYGGLKQIDPVGPHGELIIDYSIYDALKAGFRKIVFVIKKEIDVPFREAIGSRIEKYIKTEYAYQELEMQFASEGRRKPWGTGHAVLCSRAKADAPFGVINADDFYGASSFRALYDFLNRAEEEDGMLNFSLVGFPLKNTLTEHGHVARGICEIDGEGYLKSIHERTKIMKFGTGAKYTLDDKEWIAIPDDAIVSMNMWGFTPGIFPVLESEFIQFVKQLKENEKDCLKAEFFLPEVVETLLKEKRANVKVLPSAERWYGVTYKEDKSVVKEAIANQISNGGYPKNLWGER